MRVYPYGYGGKFKTEAEYDVWGVWLAFDPEYRRRVRAAMEHSYDNGFPIGVGGGIRTDSGQEALFLSRHHEVASGGCCEYKGKRYALDPGEAHAAPPNITYHDDVTPDGKCLAADMINKGLGFILPRLEQFGLKHFGPAEPWHWQVVELPNSRRYYDPAKHHPLPIWPLPGQPTPPPEDTDMPTVVNLRIYDSNITGDVWDTGTERAIAVPFSASVGVFNIAVAQASANGNVQAWQTGAAAPDPLNGPSVLNFEAGRACNATAHIGVGPARAIGIRTSVPVGRVIIDLQATFP